MRFIETNYQHLVKNYVDYIAEANRLKDDFSGPSLHFHNRALEECKKDFLSDRHIEMIYATLASWGMHRMGKTLTKMKPFNEFKGSILKLKDNLSAYSTHKIENATDSDIHSLKDDVCFKIELSESDSKIVGNSKVLAHILPELVPPIDRQYTIRFFTSEPENFINERGTYKMIQNFKGTEEEKECFSHIMGKAREFISMIKSKPEIKLDNDFNTSYPKIFDNLIMAYVKKKKNKS